jgi:hypothetical protein
MRTSLVARCRRGGIVLERPLHSTGTDALPYQRVRRIA